MVITDGQDKLQEGSKVNVHMASPEKANNGPNPGASASDVQGTGGGK